MVYSVGGLPEGEGWPIQRVYRKRAVFGGGYQVIG